MITIKFIENSINIKYYSKKIKNIIINGKIYDIGTVRIYEKSYSIYVESSMFFEVLYISIIKYTNRIKDLMFDKDKKMLLINHKHNYDTIKYINYFSKKLDLFNGKTHQGKELKIVIPFSDDINAWKILLLSNMK